MSRERWTRRKARWYARAVEESDYSRAVLAALSDPLNGCRSVADVGAGGGAIAIPLLERGLRVTAVEPAAPMRELLCEGARAAGREDLLTVVDTDWALAEIPRHDLLLFINVPGRITSGGDFLARTGRIAARVALVQNAGPRDKFWYRELYPLLFGRQWEGRGEDYHETVERLGSCGVRPEVRLFSYHMDQPFEDFEDAVAFWRERLEPLADESVLREFLRARLTKRGDRWTAAFGPRRAALLWWDTNARRGNGAHPPPRSGLPGGRGDLP